MAGRSPKDGSEVNFHPRHRLNMGQPGAPRVGPREENSWPEQPVLMGTPLRMNPEAIDGTGDWIIPGLRYFLSSWPM